MKSVVLASAAALVLIALPAVAQYSDPSTTTQPSTTTTTTMDTTATTPTNNLDTSTTTTTPATTTTTNVPVQEERTNPAVPTHSPNSGLTASGSVASWNTDEVVLRTATGLTHFKLLPNTTGVSTFTEGQRVTIDFDRNEQGVLLAKQIRLEGETAPVAQGITTTGASAAGAEVAQGVGVGETTGAGVDTTATDSSSMSTTTESTSTNLPATGSNAPLAGLLGLLALGGAAALRRL